jgi:predicted phage terminase large subunit-like protein
VIAEALERVERGDCRRLIITVPPRHYKSTTTAQLFATWYLGRNPNHRIINAAYGAHLAEKSSRAARNLIQSERFARVFPHARLSEDSQNISEWSLAGGIDRGGYQAVGVGGPITGSGAHLLIIDDPVKNRADADNENAREALWAWYTSDCYSRLQPNPLEGRIVVIHTRFHRDDLIGRLLRAGEENPSADQWEVVHFPAISEAGKPLYWPLEAYEHERAVVQPIDWAALWQGDPIVSEGQMFQAGWFQLAKRIPRFERYIRYYDLSLGQSRRSDWSVGALVGMEGDGSLYVLDLWRARAKPNEIREAIVRNAKTDPPGTSVGLPRDLIGIPMIDDLRVRLDVPIWPLHERGTKVQRAGLWQSRASTGHLFIAQGSWNDVLIREATSFPDGPFDDCVDAVSGAVALLYRTQGGEVRREEFPKADTYEYFEALAAQARERRERDEVVYSPLPELSDW